jgi:electron transfer flavoprotein alpha/beta subunit
MRILASFKVTPDYEALRAADWAAGAADGPETRYVRRILNCFDEAALELALRLKEALAERDVVTALEAVSVGDAAADAQLKTLQALGYERAARVAPGAVLDFAPSVTATIIAAYAHRAGPFDLLLLGCRCGPGDSGTVPFLVAEKLGWPCLSQVTEVEALAGGRIRATCATDEGLLRATLRPPCVLAVGNAVVSHLRVPTLTDRLACRGTRVDVLTAADLGLDVARELGNVSCSLRGLHVIDRSRPGVVVGGATPREKAQKLFEEHLRPLVEQS